VSLKTLLRSALKPLFQYDSATGLVLPTSGGQIMVFSALTGTANQFLAPGTYLQNSTSTAGENLARFKAARDMWIRNLTALGPATTTFTLRVASADTALTVSSAGGYVTDSTHVVMVPAGSYVAMKISGTAGGACECTIEIC
jgi:hypothetical protein